MQLKENLQLLIQKKNLDAHTCQTIFTNILNEKVNPLQTMAFLLLMRAKGETPDEMYGIVSALRSAMIPVPLKHKVMDIVGTGGDCAKTVNISTGSAILAASCGIKIAKHGNRSVSSLSGSADVLEALGINIHLTPEKIAQSIDEINISFCFYPLFHPALKKLYQLRRELNVPTTLNLIGPLLNPTSPAYNLIGVYSETLMPLMAELVQRLGTKRSVIFHGGGLDEISCVAPINMIEVKGNETTKFVIDAVHYGLSRARIADLEGGDAKVNAQLLVEAFSGKQGAIADSLIFNVAVALYIDGAVSSIEEGVLYAREKLFDGSALRLLKKWVEYSHD